MEAPLLGTVPAWIWVGSAVVAIPVLGVLAAVAYELTKERPALVVKERGTRLELWHSPRQPARTDLVIVPVATDQMLVAGSALWVRGATADQAQRDADPHAPRNPGEAVLVSGAPGRFKRTALAVVMDEQKRWSADWVRQSLLQAVSLGREHGLAEVLFPDWTPDLMRQPRVQDDLFRKQEAERIAPILVEATRSLIGEVAVVRLWIRDAAVFPVYRDLLNTRAPAQAVAA